MATKYYIGKAGIVAGRVTVTVNSNTATEIVGIAVGTRTETYTIPTGLTVAQVAANLHAQLIASPALEFRELTFAYAPAGATIVVTHLDPQVDFTVTAAGTGGAVTVTVDRATTGPGDLNNAANWNGSTLPADGDSLIFDLPDTPITINLSAFSSLTFPLIRITNRHNRGIGLPRYRRSSGGVGGYLEYRTRFFRVAACTRFVIDDEAGAVDSPGPQVAAFRADGGSCTAVVHCSNRQPNDDEPPVVLGLLGSGNAVNLTRGAVQIPNDALAGVAAVVATVNVGRDGDAGEAPHCHVTGTVTTINNHAGVTSASTATTVNMGKRAQSHEQTGGNLTATVRGGTLIYRTAGTLTVTADGPGVIVDCERSTEAKTIHNSSTFRNGAALLDRNGTTAGSTASFDGPSAAASKVKDNVAIAL